MAAAGSRTDDGRHRTGLEVIQAQGNFRAAIDATARHVITLTTRAVGIDWVSHDRLHRLGELK